MAAPSGDGGRPGSGGDPVAPDERDPSEHRGRIADGLGEPDLVAPVLVPDGPDKGLPWHYGDPFGEQRALTQGGGQPVGVWAREALRIAARQPRVGLDVGPGVDVGRLADCRLCLVHLDGSADEPLPPVGTPLLLDGRPVGRLGTSAQHYELGPIGLALVAQDIPSGVTVLAGSTPAMVDD